MRRISLHSIHRPPPPLLPESEDAPSPAEETQDESAPAWPASVPGWESREGTA